MRNPTLDQ